MADPRIVLKPNAGSDRSWVWNAFDYTEGQLEEITFALRLGNSDSANEFKEVRQPQRGEETGRQAGRRAGRHAGRQAIQTEDLCFCTCL